MSSRLPSRASARANVTRRALVGAAWTLAWTVVWGCALLMFANRAHAASLAPAASFEASAGGLVR
jgi:hypothetical protein